MDSFLNDFFGANALKSKREVCNEASHEAARQLNKIMWDKGINVAKSICNETESKRRFVQAIKEELIKRLNYSEADCEQSVNYSSNQAGAVSQGVWVATHKFKELINMIENKTPFKTKL